jgi:hypothetical protein
MEEVTPEDLSRYYIEGVDHMLTARVCKMLKYKWQILSDYSVDMPRMMDHYGSDRETLIRIIKWYESNLLSTTFTING